MPSPLQITFEVAGEQQFNRTIFAVEDSAKDLSPAYKVIAEEFRDTEKKQFAEEGGLEDNTPWKQLSEKYENWKRRNFPGKTILRLRDWLYKSLTIKNAPYSIERITPETLEIGTSVPYAIYHQQGRGRLPVRKPVLLTDAQKKRWVRIIRDYIGRRISAKEGGTPYFATPTVGGL